MAEIFKFFNSAPGDRRTYQAADFASYFGSVLSTGFLHTNEVPGMEVRVVEGTLTTVVSPGKAIMKGYAYENTEDLTLTHSIPEVAADRIDRIVLRLDLRNSERSIRLAVKEGSSAATPQAPELQRDNFIYELSLAQVTVRKNTAQLLAADLKDERLIESLGGLVYSLISIPTEQFQRQWDEFIKGVQEDGFATPAYVREYVDNIINDVEITRSLRSGTQVIESKQTSLADFVIEGNTQVNLLGSDGNFETDSNGDGVADGWTSVLFGATASLVSTDVKYGVMAQRITANSTDTSDNRRIYRSFPALKAKKYVIVGDVTTNGATPAAIATSSSFSASTGIVKTSTSKTLFLKYPSSTDSTANIFLFNGAPVGSTGWVQFDGVGIYEVSDELYNRIGVDINESNIRDYLPHVDGRQHVQGVVVTNQGKNMAPAFPDTLHANAKVNGPYDLTLTATNIAQLSILEITVIPNTKYTLSVEVFGGNNARWNLTTVKGSPNNSIFTNQTATGSVSFVTDSSTRTVYLNLYSSTSGTYTFKNWQLEVGDKATPFEPSDPQRLILPVTLASTPDGSVRDSVYYRDGEWRLMKRVNTSVTPAVSLATPVESIVRYAEGGISLHPGGNQITVETGIIQREKVTPHLASGLYYINGGASTLSKRTNSILTIYKGTTEDVAWKKSLRNTTDAINTTRGRAFATIPQADFDTKADYYATYLALDNYNLTTNVRNATMTFSDGLSGVVSGLVTDVIDLRETTDRHEFADTYIQANVENVRIDIGNLPSLQTTAKNNLVSAVNELFIDVVNGKNGIASAINGKGGTAAGSDSFAELANKIAQISTGGRSLVNKSNGREDVSTVPGVWLYRDLFTIPASSNYADVYSIAPPMSYTEPIYIESIAYNYESKAASLLLYDDAGRSAAIISSSGGGSIADVKCSGFNLDRSNGTGMIYNKDGNGIKTYPMPSVFPQGFNFKGAIRVVAGHAVNENISGNSWVRGSSVVNNCFVITT